MATVKDLTNKVQALTVNVDALLTQLECPVCLDTCLPPIYMCRNGHNLCSNRRSKVNECPTCREPGRPDIKNVFAEGVNRQLTVNCENKKYGCQSLILKSKLDEHLLDCPHRFVCWQCFGYHGDIPSLTQHLAANHYSEYGVEEYEGVIQVLSLSTRYLYCHGVLFFCVIVPADDGLRLNTVFFGPRKNAAHFHCWFEFISEDGAFKFSHRVPCSPTGTKLNPSKCVYVDLDCLKTPLRGDGTVLCRIKIDRSIVLSRHNGEILKRASPFDSFGAFSVVVAVVVVVVVFFFFFNQFDSDQTVSPID